MFLVHELTHVWQWQNRALTGYHPRRPSPSRSRPTTPTSSTPRPPRRSSSHGYEVQASLVEEYLCCATLDPEGARTRRLKSLLRAVMPVAEPEAFARAVWVPVPRICGLCRTASCSRRRRTRPYAPAALLQRQPFLLGRSPVSRAAPPAHRVAFWNFAGSRVNSSGSLKQLLQLGDLRLQPRDLGRQRLQPVLLGIGKRSPAPLASVASTTLDAAPLPFAVP